MSVSDISQLPCSADASPGIDNSGHGTGFSLPRMLNNNVNSPESKPRLHQPLATPDADADDDDVGDQVTSLQGLSYTPQYDSDQYFAHPGGTSSAASDSDGFDPSSSPRCRSPTSSTSSHHPNISSSEGTLPLPAIDLIEGWQPSKPGNSHSGGTENEESLLPEAAGEATRIQEQSHTQTPPAMRHRNSENLSLMRTSDPYIEASVDPALNDVGEGSSRWATANPAEHQEWSPSVHESPSSKPMTPSHSEFGTLNNSMAHLSSIDEDHVGIRGIAQVGHDPNGNSDSDEHGDDELHTHLSLEDLQSPTTSIDSDVPSNLPESEPSYHEEQNSPADSSGATGNDDLFDLIQAGSNLLTEFDFDSFLDESDPMDLDNAVIAADANLGEPPLNNLGLNAIPQVIFPPHIQPIAQQWLINHPLGIFQGNGADFFPFATTVEDDGPEWPGPQHYGEYERNLSFGDFCSFLSSKYRQDPAENARFRINPDHLDIVNFHLPAEVNRGDIDEEQPDYQGIPWSKLDIERHRYRTLRNDKYKNYANMTPYPEPPRIRRFAPIRENFLRFRKTCNTVDVRFSHFQLRNVVSAVSKNDVYYTEDSTVVRIDPQTNQTETIMDFRKPYSGDPIKITTLASDYGVIIAGGFYGEYAMKSLDSPLKSKPIEGLVTTDSNGITNHVHFYKSRSTGTPRAVFSSNDEKLRTLDCYLNKMVAESKLPWAINCSATSPDGRLRAIVGDDKEVVIQGVDDGEIIHSLSGHVDFGFACAWSEDGYTIATGNQDMMIRVYDARKFKEEVAVLDADIAGARSLRFSPLGSGPRVLAWAEPADMVSIIDAVTWESRQRIDFFGEIAGISFTPDGRELYIGNSDKTVGGLMQFERWKNGAFGQLFDEDQAGMVSEYPLSARKTRFRDINMDFLGVI